MYGGRQPARHLGPRYRSAGSRAEAHGIWEGYAPAGGPAMVYMSSLERRSVEETARNAENRALQCIVVSDCCTAGEREVHDMTIQ